MHTHTWDEGWDDETRLSMSIVSGEVCKHELILHAFASIFCSFEVAAYKT